MLDASLQHLLSSDFIMLNPMNVIFSYILLAVADKKVTCVIRIHKLALQNLKKHNHPVL
jgi:hypothetical protein